MKTESTPVAVLLDAIPVITDNTVLSSEKENCTHGTICSFPSVGV
jgi:hypothetical protein